MKAPQSLLLTDIRIFDGERILHEKGSILIESGKISRISSEPIPVDDDDDKNDVIILSKPGHTILPGLIDVHIHANSGDRSALPQALRFGVTTVCDMYVVPSLPLSLPPFPRETTVTCGVCCRHKEWSNVRRLKQQQAEEGDCADLKYASTAATIEMGWPMPIVLMHDDTPQVNMNDQKPLSVARIYLPPPHDIVHVSNSDGDCCGCCLRRLDERRNRYVAEAGDARRRPTIRARSRGGGRALYQAHA